MSIRERLAFDAISLYLAAVAGLVPRDQRERWLEEWRAEVWCALRHGRLASALRRCLGAPRDAFWTRRPHRDLPPPHPSSPRRGLDALMQDIRYALRSLRRRPAFTATAVLMLAIGIGATSGLYGVVRHSILEPLPWQDPDRLVQIYESRPFQESRDRNTASLPDVHDWWERSESFEAMAPFRYRPVSFAPPGEAAISVIGNSVGWQFFRALGLEPALGRDFAESDDRPGAPATVIVSHGFWQETLGGDPDAIGRELRLDDVPHTVIGVLPDRPAYYFNSRLWIPMRLDPAEEHRGNHSYRVVARLAPGVTLERARAELDGIARDLEREHPDNNEGHYTSIYRFQDELTRDTAASLWMVLALAGILLLVVCVNLANMQLAAALDRQREVAVRLAIGATTGRIAIMLMIESLLIAGAGALLGFLLARGTIDRLVPPAAWQTGPTVDPATFTFALALAAATSVVFGLWPALRLARRDVFDSIRDGGGTVAGSGTGLRGALVAVEVAMAVVLVMGSGLLIRSLLELTSVDPGFDRAEAVAVQVNLPTSSYPDGEARSMFFERLAEATRTLPGVASAGTTDTLPLAGSSSSSTFRIESREAPEYADQYTSNRHVVSPGYFEAMGIRLLDGRPIEAADGRDAESIVVVNAEFARRYFPGDDPIGNRISVWGDRWHRIVGIVEPVRHFGPAVEAPPEMYFSVAQEAPHASGWVVVHRESPEIEATDAIRAAVAEIDPDAPVASVATLDWFLDRSVSSTRRLTRAVGLFGSVALLVAAMGLYGVIAYVVGRRRREIGLRLALGETARGVITLIVAQGMRLVVVGLAAGLAASLALAPLVRDQLFGVAPTDPLSLLGSAGALGIVALVATLIPALRAARIDPAGSLRAG